MRKPLCVVTWALAWVWPLAFTRASAGVLCSAVVASMAAHADVVINLKFVMTACVPGRGAIRRH
jgi:hypothetical protein